MEALVGLYCELHVLRELLGRDQRSVSFWTGPLGAPFDFISGTLAIEAKAVLAAGWNVVIHGLDQLDVPSGVELWLCVHQLHRTESDGESVPELVDDVISSGVDRAVCSPGWRDWTITLTIAISTPTSAFEDLQPECGGWTLTFLGSPGRRSLLVFREQ